MEFSKNLPKLLMQGCAEVAKDTGCEAFIKDDNLLIKYCDKEITLNSNRLSEIVMPNHDYRSLRDHILETCKKLKEQ